MHSSISSPTCTTSTNVLCDIVYCTYQTTCCWVERNYVLRFERRWRKAKGWRWRELSTTYRTVRRDHPKQTKCIMREMEIGLESLCASFQTIMCFIFEKLHIHNLNILDSPHKCIHPWIRYITFSCLCQNRDFSPEQYIFTVLL